MTTVFDVTDALPEGTVSSLDPGASVLVLGPSMSGKQRVAVDLLASNLAADEGILWIETSSGGPKLERVLLESPAVRREGAVGVVPCSGDDYRYPLADRYVQPVSSPSDLTGISIAVAKLQSALADGGATAVRNGMHNLSTLVHYTDAATVFRFLHVFTGRIATTGDIGVFTLDDAAHDQRTINTLASEFDGVVELRDASDGGRELRVKGLGEGPSGWIEF